MLDRYGAECSTFCLRLWHSVHDITILFLFRGAFSGLTGLAFCSAGALIFSCLALECARGQWRDEDRRRCASGMEVSSSQVSSPR